MVEVDSSYYAMPSATTAQLWAERTPEDFVFNVKSFRLFTGHATETKVLHTDIRKALPGHGIQEEPLLQRYARAPSR